MHSVCETKAFAKGAEDAGMTMKEVEDLITFLSENPMAGVAIKGAGGCRKLRWAGKGKGKSGGYRTITFYSGSDLPVFLITLFSKGEKVNLTQDEKNILAGITKDLIAAYRSKVVKVSGER